jgi:hypothetical protein
MRWFGNCPRSLGGDVRGSGAFVSSGQKRLWVYPWAIGIAGEVVALEESAPIRASPRSYRPAAQHRCRPSLLEIGAAPTAVASRSWHPARVARGAGRRGTHRPALASTRFLRRRLANDGRRAYLALGRIAKITSARVENEPIKHELDDVSRGAAAHPGHVRAFE